VTILFSDFYFSSRSLLKTFSMNPFQGQYPNTAVRITTSPTNPRTQRKTPEVKKAITINIAPMIIRKIPSPFPTFFTFTVGFSFLSSGAINKNSPLLSETGSKVFFTHVPFYVVGA